MQSGLKRETLCYATWYTPGAHLLRSGRQKLDAHVRTLRLTRLIRGIYKHLSPSLRCCCPFNAQ